MSEQPDDVLSAQDYNEIWYLVDYYGGRMWPAEKVQRFRTLIKQAQRASAQ